VHRPRGSWTSYERATRTDRLEEGTGSVPSSAFVLTEFTERDDFPIRAHAALRRGLPLVCAALCAG